MWILRLLCQGSFVLNFVVIRDIHFIIVFLLNDIIDIIFHLSNTYVLYLSGIVRSNAGKWWRVKRLREGIKMCLGCQLSVWVLFPTATPNKDLGRSPAEAKQWAPLQGIEKAPAEESAYGNNKRNSPLLAHLVPEIPFMLWSDAHSLVLLVQFFVSLSVPLRRQLPRNLKVALFVSIEGCRFQISFFCWFGFVSTVHLKVWV